MVLDACCCGARKPKFWSRPFDPVSKIAIEWANEQFFCCHELELLPMQNLLRRHPEGLVRPSMAGYLYSIKHRLVSGPAIREDTVGVAPDAYMVMLRGCLMSQRLLF